MNYPELKRSHDEMTEAIERHNEQVSNQITEKVFGERIDQAQQRQSKLIQQAREALHRGDYR